MIFDVNKRNIWTTAENTANYIVENIDKSYFDTYLDKKMGPIDFDGAFRRPSKALRSVDKRTYSNELDVFKDRIYYDALNELNEMEKYEILTLYGFEIRSFDDELCDNEE